MNIKSLVLVGSLVIIGGAAFVYLDPMDLDLLGLKKGSVVVQPVATPRVAAPAAKPGVAAPAAKPSAAAPVVAPSPAVTPVVAASVAPPVVATVGQALQPPLKLANMIKTAKKPSQSGQPAAKPATSKPERPKDSDLRHCLELETDAAIAKCAGE